jgi:hypothetical protein
MVCVVCQLRGYGLVAYRLVCDDDSVPHVTYLRVISTCQLEEHVDMPKPLNIHICDVLKCILHCMGYNMVTFNSTSTLM